MLEALTQADGPVAHQGFILSHLERWSSLISSGIHDGVPGSCAWPSVVPRPRGGETAWLDLL